MSDDSYLLLSPPQLSDAEATALCDFLCELAAAADSHYVAQILRYRQRQQSSSRDPEKPRLSKTDG